MLDTPLPPQTWTLFRSQQGAREIPRIIIEAPVEEAKQILHRITGYSVEDFFVEACYEPPVSQTFDQSCTIRLTRDTQYQLPKR